MPCYLWYERIASYCNPADLPSRRRTAEACQKWNLGFGGDVSLPSELYTSILDGSPFPRVEWDGCEAKWILTPRGKHMDPIG